ncbi:Transcription factor dpl-1 [Clonorchis sinensis]|uniref:Transcription factor dpl-1 n=1 Tax=Clonorchis sinensis TaxID=79923 RepID=A0A419PR92_CLOSI|nr:Transcription factor dpl-1 [Clonorchis sinensis]
MDYKAEQYVGNPHDLFDIPAAEQEITVGPNEQTVLSSSLVTQSPIVTSVAPVTSIVIDSSANLVPQNTQTTPHPPRVIMLQRPGQTPGVSLASPPQRPAIKTVKIITVPGQGVGGKPLRAAVIPMHMLQRSMKVISSTGSPIVSGALSGAPSVPRLLTIRTPAQLASSGTILGGIPSVSTVRPGTLILSSAAGATPITHGVVSSGAYQPSEDIENTMVTSGDGIHAPQSGIVATQGGYYDLSTGLPASGPLSTYFQPPSPPGHDSGDEQEQMSTGFKTNGLRRYARCVCNKVKEKGVTSYSEVADELVHEYAAEHPMIPSEQLHYIQKNIRRRVYDALNVLMALNVLQKEKKEIRWVGLPINMIEECRRLEEEREKSQVALRNKTVEIQELILQLIAFKNLVMRNRINDRYRRSQTASESQASTGDDRMADFNIQALGRGGGNQSGPRTEKIPLPFLVISTHRKTVIDCNISTDKLEYLFNFDQAFEIRDEVDTLKRMGLMLRLGSIHCTQEEYNQCLELVPPSLRFYVEAIYERRQAIVPDFEALHQQRRLFVEARLAAAAANSSSGQHDEHDDEMGHEGPVGGLRNTQPSPVEHGSRYSSLFDGGVGCHTSDSTLRRLYLSGSVDDTDDSHLVSGAVPPTGFVPGDTQHYARAAASRGYVVPGGPGGLLRHRQVPGSHVERGMHSSGTGTSSTVGSLVCSINNNAREDITATTTLGSATAEHVLSHDDELVDDELMGDPGEEDDDDDEDMEDV